MCSRVARSRALQQSLKQNGHAFAGPRQARLQLLHQLAGSRNKQPAANILGAVALLSLSPQQLPRWLLLLLLFLVPPLLRLLYYEHYYFICEAFFRMHQDMTFLGQYHPCIRTCAMTCCGLLKIIIVTVLATGAVSGCSSVVACRQRLQ